MQNNTRRKVLSGIGSTLLYGVGITKAASLQQDGDLPTRVGGKRRFTVMEDDGGKEYRLDEEFYLDDQSDVSLGTESVELDSQIVNETSAARLNREAFRKTDISYESGTGTGFQFEYHDTAIIGTFEQHFEHEKYAREQETMDVVHVTPRFVYKSDDPSGRYDIAEMTGPINLGWAVGKDAGGVASNQPTSGSWAIELAGTRYIINANGVTSQDKDVGEKRCMSHFCTGPQQYHVRLYDNNYSEDDVSVIGQAHYDPMDHGHLTDPDWRFSDSRREISEDWTDVSTVTLSNGRFFSSSDGWMDHIQGLPEDDDDDTPIIILDDDSE